MDDNVYSLGEMEAASDQSVWALHVNGLFMRDSLVGHSTVFNVKTADKSLMINGKWNPFIGQRPLAQGDFWMVGADTALRMPLTGAVTMSAEAEINHARYDNEYGTLSLTGGRAQVGVHQARVDLGLRYAFLNPDDAFAVGGAPITGGGMIHEITPSLTYHLGSGQNSKVVLDLPILIDVPVVTEPGVGAYVLTEQPDQASVLGDEGTVGRQNVVEARMLIQMGF